MQRPRTVMGGQVRQALEELGGEPLEGSGFEDETPDEGFGDAEERGPHAGAPSC